MEFVSANQVRDYLTNPFQNIYFCNNLADLVKVHDCVWMYEFNLVIQSTFGPLTAEGVHAIRDNLLLFETLSVTINTVFASEDVHDLYMHEVLPLMRHAGFSGSQNGLVWKRDLYISKLLATMIDRKIGLTSLELQRVVFQKTEAQLLGKLMEETTNLQTLNLNFSAFYDFSDFIHVADGLGKNKSILAFYMSHCDMNDSNLMELAKSLENNQTLISLTLANNHKTTYVGQDAMASMLQYNNTLLIVNIWLLSTFLKNITSKGWNLQQQCISAKNNLIEKVLHCNLSILEISSFPVNRNVNFAKNQGFRKVATLLCALRRVQPNMFIPSDIVNAFMIQLAEML
jgi:hypothetical protein